jgi:hypothetical protein
MHWLVPGAGTQVPDLLPEWVCAGGIQPRTFLASDAFGGATLHYQGQSYGFTIGGLGVGAFGIATLHATGEVYDLHDVADFGGVYGQAGASYALGQESAGTLWLENPKGVHLHLKAEREGIILSIGADGVIIKMD